MSDVSCPWCVIGLKSLEQALDNVGDAADASIHFQPFELNPAMVPEGEDIGEHIAHKYGASAEQRAQTSEMIRARGAELGFEFGSATASTTPSTPTACCTGPRCKATSAS